MLVLKRNEESFNNIFERVVCSGSKTTAYRTLEITYLHKEATFNTGETVELFHDGVSIFTGDIVEIRKNMATNMYKFIAYDNNFRLTKNEFIENFTNVTPSTVAKLITSKLGLPLGSYPKDDDIKCCTFPAIGKTGFEIIMMAYTLFKNLYAKLNIKKVYSVVWDDKKINIVESGTLLDGIVLETQKNIIDIEYFESIENMINKVVVHDNGEVIDTLENSGNIERFGTFQTTVEQNKNSIDTVESFKMLKDLDRKITLNVLGNNQLISGYSVPLKLKNEDSLNGVFYIDSDTHYWVNNEYITELTLTFENTMTDIEIEKSENKKKKNAVDYSLIEGE
ncbi:MAG: XkdQ/YqbQ family protein [Cetobacterium sp.]|uniref:XkdQ/YqbQ family protein n=1 Tax=Cetobacterium sp. TaxID=2071632 RepID=UPI003F2B5820